MGAANLNLGSLGHLDKRQIFVRLREMQQRFGWEHPSTTDVIKEIQERMQSDSLPNQEFAGYPAVNWTTFPEARDGREFSTFVGSGADDPNRDGDDGPSG